MEEYKNNSQKAKEEQQKPKFQPVVKGEVKQKESLGKKVMSTFIHEDKESVKNYIFMEVIVPKIKEVTLDVVTGALSMLFYGDSSAARKGNKNYSGISTASYNNGKTNYRNESMKTSIDGIILSTRVDAANVLNQMRDILTDYQKVTVADYLDLVGISSNFTDNSRGWTNLDSAYISNVPGGFTIKLLVPRQL